jgi:hypothetical protein
MMYCCLYSFFIEYRMLFEAWAKIDGGDLLNFW